jgi:hypothetical protein
MRTILSTALAGNEVGIPNSILNEVVQGFQVDFTPKGRNKFDAEKITQRRHKVDNQIQPDVIVGEWEAWLYDEKKTRKDMPIVRYILNKLIAKIQEDRETQMVFKGKYAAPTEGVAGAAVKAVDGIGVLLTNASTAGKYDPFALGVPTESTIFEYLEDYLSLIPQLHRYKKLEMFMSQDWQLFYQRDKRDTFAWMQKMEDLLKIDFSNITINGLPSMAGSNLIFTTVPGNMARIIHKTKDMDNVDMQVFERYIKTLADWHESYGFATYDYVWSNDQGLDLDLYGVEESGS